MKIVLDELTPVDITNTKDRIENIKVKMIMDNDCDIVKSIVEPNGVIQKHTQMCNEYIYVVSGQARIIIEEEEEIINKDEIHFCPLGHTHEIFNNKDEELVLLNISINEK